MLVRRMLSLAFITCLQESVLYSDNTRRWAQRHCSWTCAGLHKHLMISGSFLQAFSVFAGIFSSVILDHSSDCGLLGIRNVKQAREDPSDLTCEQTLYLVNCEGIGAEAGEKILSRFASPTVRAPNTYPAWVLNCRACLQATSDSGNSDSPQKAY